MDPIVRSVSNSNKDGEESEPQMQQQQHHHAPDRSEEGVSGSLQSLELERATGGHLVANEIPPAVEEDDDEDDMNNAAARNDHDDDEEEEDDYEYEDDDAAAFSGFLVDNPAVAVAQAIAAPPEHENNSSNSKQPATIEQEDSNNSAVDAAASAPPLPEQQQQPPPTKKKWRQPSEEAVSMSLRAEKETTGGKRRLAQDLFRIMQQDTAEAGFALQPTVEDSMERWTIRLFQFDRDSNLAKDMRVLGLENIELEMSFPDQYPFEPPFVRVTRPRFKRQTGFVMNGALCMELLTKDGWNPVNDIESVIVSIRSLLVVGDGRLEAAFNLPEAKYKALLEAASSEKPAAKKPVAAEESASSAKRKREEEKDAQKKAAAAEQQRRMVRDQGGSYSVSEAEAAYTHLSDYHKKKGWDTSGWWARKG